MSRWEWALACGVAALVAGLLVVVLDSKWPHVGHDFSYFLPRLIDVRLHQLQEGAFRVQWWTPSFGAGLPAFANPQHTQFMPAQALVPWLGPWGAAVAQAAAFLALGVLLLFYSCRKCLGITLGGSLVAATAFGTSGFYWHHTLTGHVSYNAFPLVAVIPCVLHNQHPRSRAIALLGLAAAAIVYTGGYTVILVFSLTALLFAWLLPLCNGGYTTAECFRRLFWGGLLCAAIASAKVVAASDWLAAFPRLAEYRFSGPTWLAPVALFSQVFVVRSVAMASRWLPTSGESFHARFGAGEDVGSGPAVIVVLAAALALLWHRRRFAGRAAWWQWCGLAAAIWITAEAALGRGLIWPLLKPLPFLRTLHENHRLTAAFVVPVLLLFALGWDVVMAPLSARLRAVALGVGLALTVASLEPMFRDRGGYWWSSFDATTIHDAWERLRRDPGERFPVRAIAAVRDDAGFAAGASSLATYEPIFSYGFPGKQFRTQLTPGPVTALADGNAWRFHHPLAFVAPTLAGVAPFAAIPARERDNLLLLLDRHQPPWPLPRMQRVANWTALLAFGAALVLALWPHRRGIGVLP